MTNEPVEGINNKRRVIARRAYGFHSHEALISMLLPPDMVAQRTVDGGLIAASTGRVSLEPGEHVGVQPQRDPPLHRPYSFTG